MAKKKRALQGIRVLDASTVIAGPTIGMLLGDFGADVIKIEHPRGDVLRETGHQKDGVGLWFKMANRNKRCITMNFSTTEGAELLKELIKTTDVLIENFRTSTMEKWGLGWDTLKIINHKLLHQLINILSCFFESDFAFDLAQTRVCRIFIWPFN